MASSKSSGVSSAASEPFYLHIPPPSTSASSDDNSSGAAAAATDGKQRVYLTFSSSVVSGSSDRGAIQYVFSLVDSPHLRNELCLYSTHLRKLQCKVCKGNSFH